MPKTGNHSSGVAKKPFAIYLDKSHHRILDALAERDGISKGEAARRIIKSYRIDVVPAASPPQNDVTESASATH